MRSKFEPAVYSALRNAGMSNREIARQLDVNESSVRRGLKDAPPASNGRRLVVYVFES